MDIYRMNEICFILYGVMIILIIWNYKKTSTLSLLVNMFSAIGLIFYQYFILKQQVSVRANYVSIIAILVGCGGMMIYVIVNTVVYYILTIKRKNVHTKSN